MGCNKVSSILVISTAQCALKVKSKRNFLAPRRLLSLRLCCIGNIYKHKVAMIAVQHCFIFVHGGLLNMPVLAYNIVILQGAG